MNNMEPRQPWEYKPNPEEQRAHEEWMRKQSGSSIIQEAGNAAVIGFILGVVLPILAVLALIGIGSSER